ncbi:myosin-14-like [Bacillus rossius redtenbacheri]|uniref:myosin-14-like n=1 Tax=Bacillus rossius redtenbacheri TaxID=93214 RepID=UPI002FDC8B27
MAAGLAQINADTLAKSIKLKLPGFRISGQDLRTPNRDTVVSYYTTLMEEFGVDFGASANIHDMNHVIQLYSVVSYVLSNLGIKSFNIDDIMNPDAKRTLKWCVVLDNFHNFADEQAREVRGMQERRSARLAAFRQLARAKDELLERENQRAVRREVRAEQGRQLQAHMEELQATKAATVGKLQQLRDSAKIIEEKLAPARERVDELTANVAQVGAELARLEARVVPESPGELRGQEAALEAARAAQEGELRAQGEGLQQKEQRTRALAAELARLQEAGLSLERAWALLCEERKAAADLQRVREEAGSVEAACKLSRKQLREASKERTKLQRQHDKAKVNVEEKTRAFEEDLAKLKQEFSDLQKSLEQNDTELAKVSDETIAVESKKEGEVEAIKAEDKALKDAYEKYQLMVKSYAEAVLKGLKIFSDAA